MTNYDKKWDRCWNLCKKHGCTKGLSKPSIYRERPGYVDMWLLDIKRAGKITETEYRIATTDIEIPCSTRNV